MPGIFALGAVLRSQQRHSCSKDQVSGWWHQALRQMLVSEVSNFVVGSIRPSGNCIGISRMYGYVYMYVYVCMNIYLQ